MRGVELNINGQSYSVFYKQGWAISLVMTQHHGVINLFFGEVETCSPFGNRDLCRCQLVLEDKISFKVKEVDLESELIANVDDCWDIIDVERKNADLKQRYLDFQAELLKRGCVI